LKCEWKNKTRTFNYSGYDAYLKEIKAEQKYLTAKSVLQHDRGQREQVWANLSETRGAKITNIKKFSSAFTSCACHVEFSYRLTI